MRPRPDAAENMTPTAPTYATCGSFNEAAARCRGKLLHGQQEVVRSGSFNEAAARCRGKRPRHE